MFSEANQDQNGILTRRPRIPHGDPHPGHVISHHLSSETVDLYQNRIRVPARTKQRFLMLDQEASQPLVEQGVCLSGLGTFGRGYRVGYQAPTRHLLLLTLGGSGFYRSPDYSVSPSAGQLLVSPAGVPLDLGTKRSKWTFLWFYVTESRWTLPDHATAHCLSPPFADQLHHAYEGLLTESGWDLSQSVLTEAGWVTSPNQPVRPSSRVANLHGTLVAEYLATLLRPAAQDSDPWRERFHGLVKTIEQNLNEPWNQSDMCRWLGVSPATLQRQWHRLYQTTPRKMLIQLRMSHACGLLARTDYPLEIIAHQVGYADGFVFSAAFKRCFGVTPKSFRESSVATRLG